MLKKILGVAFQWSYMFALLSYSYSPSHLFIFIVHVVGDMPSVLEDTKRELCKLSEDVHKFSFDIVFGTLRGYLADVSNMEVIACVL